MTILYMEGMHIRLVAYAELQYTEHNWSVATAKLMLSHFPLSGMGEGKWLHLPRRRSKCYHTILKTYSKVNEVSTERIRIY